MLRADINGTEPARMWNHEGLEYPPLREQQQIHLSHTTVWRWSQEAGWRANKVEDGYEELWQSGIWAADSTLSKAKGKYAAVWCSE